MEKVSFFSSTVSVYAYNVSSSVITAVYVETEGEVVHAVKSRTRSKENNRIIAFVRFISGILYKRKSGLSNL